LLLERRNLGFQPRTGVALAAQFGFEIAHLRLGAIRLASTGRVPLPKDF
jgi:hypothetical protein